MPDHARAAIDATVFAQLGRMTGPEFAKELAQTFAEEAPGMLADLREAMRNGEAERYRRAAHSLKSNSQTFGATKLAAMARMVELGGIDASDRSTIDALEAEYARAAAALKALCDG